MWRTVLLGVVLAGVLAGMEWVAANAPGTADLVDAASGIVNLCRYEVIGDTLTLSVGHCRAGRPAGLDPAPKATVWEFKRVVKKD